MSGFVPVLFSKLTKPLDDAFKKKFDYDNTITVKQSTADGIKLETKATLGEEILGNVKATYKNKDFGEIVVEESTAGKFSAEVTLDKFNNDLNAKIKAESGNSKVNNGAFTGSVAGELRREFVSANLKVSVFKNVEAYNAQLEGACVLGFENVTVGATGAFDPHSNVFKNTDVAGGYETADTEFRFKTLKSGSEVEAGIFHKINKGHSIGLKGKYEKKNDNRSLALVSSYDLDSNILVKSQFSTTGDVAVALEHKLSDPRVQVNAAASFQLKGASKFTSDKFGLGLTFGEF